MTASRSSDLAPFGLSARRDGGAASAASPDTPAIWIYADIGTEDATVREVATQVGRVKDATALDIRINSFGGDVFEGVSIYEALARFGGRKIVHIDGIAASAASIVAMAGDEIRIGEAAFLMIHNASGGVFGNADDMAKMADTLRKIDARIAETYARRTGKPAEEIARMMAAETWFDAPAAIASGFADQMSRAAKAQIAARFDPARYRYRNTPDPVRRVLNRSRVKPKAADYDCQLTLARARIRAKAAAQGLR